MGRRFLSHFGALNIVPGAGAGCVQNEMPSSCVQEGTVWGVGSWNAACFGSCSASLKRSPAGRGFAQISHAHEWIHPSFLYFIFFQKGPSSVCTIELLFMSCAILALLWCLTLLRPLTRRLAVLLSVQCCVERGTLSCFIVFSTA